VRKKLFGVAGLLLSVIVALPGCTTYRYTRRASDAMVAENWDAAVYYYLEALSRDPGKMEFKIALQRARMKAGEDHFRRGMKFKEAGELARAQAELELAVQLDPTHQYAEVELAKVRKDLAVFNEEGGASKLAEMKRAASEMKVKPPLLNPASDEPMSLSFPNQTNLRDIYKAIGQAFGINILFDPKLKDSKLSIELKNVTARQALESVVEAAGQFYKVFDEKTVIVVEDTPANRRDYEDLVVKTFFLSNADVKDVNNMLRALIDARRIAVNEQLNSLVIRDTADKVAIAERLINANDKSKAEVLVDVELLQIDTSKARDIGMTLASQTFSASLDTTQLGASTAGGAIYLNQIGNITRSMWQTTVPNVVLNLIKTDSETKTLAHPQLRITEREKANLVIGEKVPIPTTTFNTATAQNGTIVPITAFTYQDVGIKLDIEPKVHHNNEITLKLKVEVSDLGAAIPVSGQPNQYPINTRNIDTVIRLKDGETSLLAGLLKQTNTTATSGLPWLSDLPVIGALFSDNSKTVNQTDLVLTLTPHIVRYPDITEEDLAPLWVGTETRVSIFGNSPRLRSAASTGPMDQASGAAASSQQNAGAQGQDSSTATQTNQPRRGRGRSSGGGASSPTGGTSSQNSSGLSTNVQSPAADISASTQGVAADVSASAQGIASDVSVATQSVASTALASTQGVVTGVSPVTQSVASSASANDTNGLPVLTFEPARLPLTVGAEGTLDVVIDPGAVGVSGQLHLAYDPARLEVTRVEGGVLQGSGGQVQVKVGHTPALGWITADVGDRVVAAGVFVRLSVRPLAPGELPVIFAGPLGALIARNGTVVAAPAAGEVVR